MQAAAKRWLPFEEARELVRKAGLKSQKEWKQWCRDGHRPETIPSHPHTTYSDEEWQSWADWLGFDEGKPLRGTFVEFEEARAYMWKEGLTSVTQWRQWCRDGLRPHTIPYHPNKIYKHEGWLSWPDWLGYGVGKAPKKGVPKDFLEFEEARAYVRKVGLESQEQWHEWCSAGHRPENIPSCPHETYADDEWLSWADWLGFGEGQSARTTFLEFEVARESVWELGLKSVEEWREWCREGQRLDTIPSAPDVTYKREGWQSWPDWLGYGKGRPARRN